MLLNTSFNTKVVHARGEDESSWRLRGEEVDFCVTNDGVHSLQSEEGRSAVVGTNTPRLWKVLVSFDGGFRSKRAPPARDTPSKTEHVEKIEKKTG